jgi:putative acetyltransferase
MPTEGAADLSSGFFIRRATNADIPAIRSVLFTVRREYGVLCACGLPEPDLDDLEQNYFGRGGYFAVLEDSTQRIVGCGALYPLSDSRVELCKMYFEASARGHGLGKLMLEDLLDRARRNGFAEVWLETNSVLTAAIGLYRKYGFEPVVNDHLLPSCDQAYLLRLE